MSSSESNEIVETIARGCVMFSRAVVRHAALIVAFGLAVTGLASASWAATVAPIPVKDKPTVYEDAPTANGAWFGWAQDPEGKPDRYDFYVQRGTGPRIKVNAAGTQGLGGAIVGDSVYYVQQFGDREPRINRFDLNTRTRSALPSKVNHNRHGRHGRLLDGVRGHVTVSGPWLLYSGFSEPGQFGYPNDTVVLYNRVTHEMRQLASVSSDWNGRFAGQVNGRYATYIAVSYGACCGDPSTEVRRYNIKTKRTVTVPRYAAGDAACASDPQCDSVDQDVPAVSSDGTVYYFLTYYPYFAGGPLTSELIRQPIGGPAEVITTLTSEHFASPGQPFVRDGSDGSRDVFYSWEGDIYKVVDNPQAAVATRR